MVFAWIGCTLVWMFVWTLVTTIIGRKWVNGEMLVLARYISHLQDKIRDLENERVFALEAKLLCLEKKMRDFDLEKAPKGGFSSPKRISLLEID